jgi:hypothetical protein
MREDPKVQTNVIDRNHYRVLAHPRETINTLATDG